jgi:hypothetical protein
MEDGDTYQIEYYTPAAAVTNRVELTGGPVVTQGGVELTKAVVYCFQPEGAPVEQIAVDLSWQAPGPQPEDVSASVRLVRVADGGTAAQVDAWLQNANGRAARAWETPDSGTQFFEFPGDPISRPACTRCGRSPTRPNPPRRCRWRTIIRRTAWERLRCRSVTRRHDREPLDAEAQSGRESAEKSA